MLLPSNKTEMFQFFYRQFATIRALSPLASEGNNFFFMYDRTNFRKLQCFWNVNSSFTSILKFVHILKVCKVILTKIFIVAIFLKYHF